MGRRPLVRRRWRRGYGVSRPCTARDASQATATTSHATTVPASMQDAFCVPSCPANVPEVSRGRRLPYLMSTTPAIGRLAHRVRSAPAARRSSAMAHPCPRGCISRRNSAILAYRANCDLAPGRRHPRAMAAHPRRISTGRLVSQSVGMAPDHAASGQLPHGRYNSAGTKVAPEQSCYHPCRCCVQGRFSAPSLPDPPPGDMPRGDAFGRFRPPAGSDGALRLRPPARRSGRSRRPVAAPASRCRDRPPAPPRCARGPPARRDRRTRSRPPPRAAPARACRDRRRPASAIPVAGPSTALAASKPLPALRWPGSASSRLPDAPGNVPPALRRPTRPIRRSPHPGALWPP